MDDYNVERSIRMEHYLTQIEINKVRHLSNIKINLQNDIRQHLLLTGRNGCGKTSLLVSICKYLKSINDGELSKLKTDYIRYLLQSKKSFENATTEKEKYERKNDYKVWINQISKYSDGLELHFNKYEDLDEAYKGGNFIK